MSKGIVPGTVLANRYEVVALLGSGGFGATYRSRDLARFGTICVVKELLSTRSENEIARRLFEREARLMSELSHPQIPTLHAYFEEDGRFFLVQDFVEGETLATRLKTEGRLPEPEVRAVVTSLLHVLEYLHGCTPPVIHRDIKPANVILGPHGSVYLIDFGAVRQAVGGDEMHTAIGTAGYTPREQAVGRPSPTSDLYALGAMALEMLSGRHPVEWHDPSTGKLDWRGKVDCSPEFESFLSGMLADLPDRFHSAGDACAALRVAGDAVNDVPVLHAASGPSTLTPSGIPAPGTLPASDLFAATPADNMAKTAVPATTERAPAEADSVDAGRRHPWLRLTLLGNAVVLVIALAVLLVVWTRREKGERAEAGIRQDTLPGPAAAIATSPQPAAPVNDSAPSNDSTAITGAAPIPAPAEDSAATRVPARDSSPSAATTPPRRTGANRKSSSGEAPESLSVACLRLLERVSVGEKLTEAEATLLRRRCQR